MNLKKKYYTIKKQYDGYSQYATHFNGGEPYLVYANDKNIHIYAFELPHNDVRVNGDNYKYCMTKLVKSYTNVVNIFYGIDTNESWDGNTILVQADATNYTFIGSFINEFELTDTILQYYSPIGNNGVPYPFAIGEKNVYFVENNEYLPIKKVCNNTMLNTLMEYRNNPEYNIPKETIASLVDKMNALYYTFEDSKSMKEFPCNCIHSTT